MFGHRRAAEEPDDDQVVELMVVPLWQSELVRTALDDAGIDCEVVQAIAPLTWSLTDARIRVRRRDREAASEVLARDASDD